jgi:hypothetical protein
MRGTSPADTSTPLRGSSTMPLRRPTSFSRAPWRRAALAIVAVAAGATAVGAPGALSRATPAAASTTGIISTVSPNAIGKTAPSTVASNRQHGALPTRSTRGTAARSNRAVPHTTASSATFSSTLLRNFNGTSSLDSAKTNYGAQFEPPDQGLCEGNGFVLEAVNSAYTVYTTAGAVVVGPYNVNDLFNEGGYEFTSDPRCFYDASTNRWFTLILFISGGGGGTTSHFDVGVSTSGDPSKFFNFYQVDTTDATGTGCPCFGDQPLFGIDQNNVYVSTNEFPIIAPAGNPNQYNGAQIYALDKTNMLAGTTAKVDHFSAPDPVTGVQSASLQPATSIGAPNAEYFLSSLDPLGTNDNRVAVWAITQRDIHGSATPVLSDVVITSEPYAFPVPAVQKGSTSPIEQNDDRMQQAEWINGSVSAELETALTIGSDPKPRDGAAWFKIAPTLNGAGTAISSAAIQRQGYVASAGNYLLYPAMAVNSGGRTAMVFTLTGANNYPSAAYAVLGQFGFNFGAPIIPAGGTQPYKPAPGFNRWGDYSYALLDTVSHTMWFATEYVPPKPSQTTNGQRNWGTRVLQLSITP